METSRDQVKPDGRRAALTAAAVVGRSRRPGLPLQTSPVYESIMLRPLARLLPLLAVLSSACGSASAPPSDPSSQPAGPAGAPAAPADDAAPSPGGDQAAAQKAAGTALTALSKRNFDVTGCNAAEARLVPEAEARNGTPQGDRCTILVGKRIDDSWLVVVRSTLQSKSYGAQARVKVTADGSGLDGIEYDR